jgi:Tol biopolymer transport system component
MSPEQAEGKAVDARSDIFSFGSILYQMATGKRAFDGSSAMATIAAVLNREPEPLPVHVSGGLERIIARSLRKDPEQRYQSMADVQVALQDLQERAVQKSLVQERVSTSTHKRTWLWVSAAVLALALSAALVFKFRSHALPPQMVVQETAYSGRQQDPAFSPDGKQIAFAWDGEKGSNPGIYVKLLRETGALRLTNGNDRNPVWSPDGTRIAFARGTAAGEHAVRSAIYTVTPLGGSERKMLDMVVSAQMSWSPDGKWLAVARGSELSSALFLLPLEGGEPRRISNPKAPAFDTAPAFSPDGRRLAFAGCADRYNCSVYIQDFGRDAWPQGRPRRATLERGQTYAVTWSRDGRSLIYSNTHSYFVPYLWRVGSDRAEASQRLEIAGPRTGSPTVSPVENRLVFQQNLDDPDIWRYTAKGGMEPWITSALVDYGPDFSPDGSKVVFTSNRSGEGMDIWLAQADGTQASRLTYGPGRAQGTPRWSPDGRWIAFDSAGSDGHAEVYVIDPKGGSMRQVTKETGNVHMPFWSRDGKWIYFFLYQPGAVQIWRTPFEGGRTEQVTTHGGMIGRISVDGQTLFFMKDYTGPLYAQPVAGGEEREVLSFVEYKAFCPAAKGIYYIGKRTAEGYCPLAFYDFASRASRTLAKIEGTIYQGVAVSPDGETVLFTHSARTGSSLMRIENFQ